MTSITDVKNHLPSMESIANQGLYLSLATTAGYYYGEGKYQYADIFVQQLAQEVLYLGFKKALPEPLRTGDAKVMTLAAHLGAYAISGVLSEDLVKRAGLNAPWYYPAAGGLYAAGFIVAGLVGIAGAIKAVKFAYHHFAPAKQEVTPTQPAPAPKVELPSVDSDNFEQVVLQAKAKVLVLAYSEKTNLIFVGNDAAVKLDVSKNEALAKTYHIESVPAVLIFENGQMTAIVYANPPSPVEPVTQS